MLRRPVESAQYLSIKYTDRLAEAEIDLSVGTVGNAYNKSLAECLIGLFKTKVFNQIDPVRSMREVKRETIEWLRGDARITCRLTGQMV